MCLDDSQHFKLTLKSQQIAISYSNVKKLSDFTQCWPYDNASIALSEYLLEHIKILLLNLILCCVLVTAATEFMNKINNFDILSQFLR